MLQTVREPAHSREHVAATFFLVWHPRFCVKVLLRGQNYDLWDSQWRVFIGSHYFVTGKLEGILSPLHDTQI